MNNERITFLDGLRGFAILLVILFHAYAAHNDLISYNISLKDLFFIKYGFFGVQLFFLLSGFVILMTLDKSKNFVSFIYKRWLRLFPAMFIASLLIYFTAPFFYERPAGMPTPYSLFPVFFFTENVFFNKIFHLNIPELEGAFWSLYVEMKFYIIFGIAYFLIGRKKAIIFLCLCFFYALINAFLPFHKPNYLNTLFTHFGWFVSGALAYIYYTQHNTKVFYISVVIGVLSLLTTFKYQNYPLEYLLIGSLFISLFYITIVYRKSRFVLSNRFFLLLGFISYPLYLIHENMMISSIVKLSKLSPMLSNFFIPFIPIVMLCVLSYFIAKVEPYIKNFLNTNIRKIAFINGFLT